MIKPAIITECWTPQSNHRDVFFSQYTLVIHCVRKKEISLLKLIQFYSTIDYNSNI